MKDNSPIYWKMRNGRLISVDDMDINHLRNLTIKGQDSFVLINNNE